MELEIEYVKANKEVACQPVFSGEQVRVSDLIPVLETLNASMPLGWQHTPSFICRRLWARKGPYISGIETFVDAFDHTVYQETVWHFSEGGNSASTDGLEIHGWGARPDPMSQSNIILLEKVADLKQLLSTVPPDLPVFSPSKNFELDGMLKNIIDLYCVKDREEQVWLMLQADSRAAWKESEEELPELEWNPFFET